MNHAEKASVKYRFKRCFCMTRTMNIKSMCVMFRLYSIVFQKSGKTNQNHLHYKTTNNGDDDNAKVASAINTSGKLFEI